MSKSKKVTKKKSNKKVALLAILALLCISMGFAVLSATLSFNGTFNIKATEWEITLGNIEIAQGSANIDEPGASKPTIEIIDPSNPGGGEDGEGGSGEGGSGSQPGQGGEGSEGGEGSGSEGTPMKGVKITYDILLDKPSDYYEFYADIENTGKIDAKIKEIKFTQLTGEAAEYINYTLSYKDGREVKVGDTLATGDKETIKVRIEYKPEATDLPIGTAENDGLNVFLEAIVTYEQDL